MSDLEGPCPRCAAVECKRWKLLDGSDVCDECWLDTAMDRQAEHWRSATAATHTPKVSQCATIRRRSPAVREFPVRPARPRVADWRAKWEELVKPGRNSACLLCGRWYYGAVLETCSRCGGRCVQRTDRDMNMMCRHATTFVESEQ
jgi:hypothetical protein